MPRPNFLIIGTARAGTTSLYYYLRQHPQIYMSPVKEPRFFIFEGRKEVLTPKGVRKLPPYSWDWNSYLSLFDGVKGEKAIGEATPGYLYYPWVPERIRARLPNVKMIAILRNPIERAYSLYLLHVRDGFEPAPSFVEALALEESRLAQGMFFGHYKRGGLYAEQLQRYFQHFSRDQFLIFLYEDLQEDTVGVVQQIFNFLEVDTSFVPDLSKKFNPAVAARRYSLLWSAVNTIAKQGWIKRITPTHVRYLFRRKLQEWKQKSLRPIPKPELDQKIKQELVEFYRDDILRLQEMLGRDLSHWLAIDGQPQDKQNDIKKMLDFVMSIEGQISRAEAQTLIQLASQVNKDAVIVEIGSYRGRSTIALAFGSRRGNQNRIYSVDPHDEFEGVCGGTFGPEDQAHFYRNITKAKVGDLVSTISLPSTDAARAWSKQNIGLLWIDGDHHYEAVRADFNAWSPYLLPGAVVAFHDVDLPGVRQLIEELLQAGKIVKMGRVDQLAWFKYQG